MNDAYGDPRNYDPNDPYWDPYEYDATWSGVPPPPAPVAAPPPSAPSAPPPTTTAPTTNPTGKTPQQIEAEGREYDRQHGLIGGYMLNGVWVNGSPTTSTGGPRGYTPGDGSGLSATGDMPTFSGWPTYQAPVFDDPGLLDPGPAFTFRDFTPPDPSKIADDPSFKFRFNQGLGALKAQRAGQGTFLTGATGKAMQEYGQGFASNELGNIYQRALDEYGTNRNNAADIWSKQYGQRQDVFGSKVNRSNSLNGFNVNNAQFDFSGRQRQAEQEFQDLYQRWAKSGDWLTTVAGYGDD